MPVTWQMPYGMHFIRSRQVLHHSNIPHQKIVLDICSNIWYNSNIEVGL